MSLQFYKPNRSNKGCAITFQSSDRDAGIYLNLINQHSWNEETHKGSFIENQKDPLKHSVVKLNQTEAASIIDAIETNSSYSTSHFTDKRTTKISFNSGDEQHPGFALQIFQTNKEDTTQKLSFFIPFTFGEARLVKEYLIHYLHKSFKIKKEKKQENRMSNLTPASTIEIQETTQESENQEVTTGDNW